MIIYLVLSLPTASSDLPESSPGRLKRFLFGLASNGVYMCPARYRAGGSLLHCLSTLTTGNRFAISRERFISVALALESPPPDVIRHPALRSPDFPHLPYGSRDHLFYLIFLEYHIIFYTGKQLPPINSLQIELLGTLWLSIPWKYSKNLSSLFAS